MKATLFAACLLALFAAIYAQDTCYVSSGVYGDNACENFSPLADGCSGQEFEHDTCVNVEASGTTISMKYDCVNLQGFVYMAADCPEGQATTVPDGECTAVFGGAAYLLPNFGEDCEGNPVDGGDDGADGTEDGSGSTTDDVPSDGDNDGSSAAALSAFLF
ncbi:hypothetical protein QOT17_004578 [Balamuthia mandrillaris]